MNEAVSVFAKEGIIVEVSYVEPNFGSCNVMSVIPRSQDI